ncbi:MAG: aminotransferase class IV [Pseudonocardiaceae bacterium]
MNVQCNGADLAQLEALALTNYGHFTSMRVDEQRVRGLSHHLERLSRDCRRVFDADQVRHRIRHALADVKHVGLFGSLRHRRIAQRNGFDDVLFTDAEGHIYEAATSNIGLIDGDQIVWPHADRLTGVTMLTSSPHTVTRIRHARWTRSSSAISRWKTPSGSDLAVCSVGTSVVGLVTRQRLRPRPR